MGAMRAAKVSWDVDVPISGLSLNREFAFREITSLNSCISLSVSS